MGFGEEIGLREDVGGKTAFGKTLLELGHSFFTNTILPNAVFLKKFSRIHYRKKNTGRCWWENSFWEDFARIRALSCFS